MEMTLNTDVLEMIKKPNMVYKREQGNQGQHGKTQRSYIKQDRIEENGVHCYDYDNDSGSHVN
jgi:hypothetical protein